MGTSPCSEYAGLDSCEQGLRQRDTGCLPTSVRSVLGRDLGPGGKGGHPKSWGAGVSASLASRNKGLRLLPVLLLVGDSFCNAPMSREEPEPHSKEAQAERARDSLRETLLHNQHRKRKKMPEIAAL